MLPPHLLLLLSMQRWRQRLSMLLLLLLVFCLSPPPFACARTVTWAQSGGGNLQSAANWDGGEVPTANDDVVIRLRGEGPDAATAAAFAPPPSSSSSPWESSGGFSSPSSSDSGARLLTLMEGWAVRSLTLSGAGASLLADARLQVASQLRVSGGAQLLVKGGTLEAAQVSVGQGGTLALDLGTVGGGSGSGGNGLSLRVQSGGLLRMSSAGGSSHFSHCDITVGSGAQALWDAGPLILDATTFRIDAGGTFRAQSDFMTQADAGSVTSVENSGTIIFDSTNLNGGSSQQTCGVPLWNKKGGLIQLTGPVGQASEVRVVNTLKQDGAMSVEGSRTLSLSYSLAEFGAGSRTMLGPNATLLCQSGEARFGGRLAAAEGNSEGGEVLVRALATQSGHMDVNALTLRGGVLATESGAVSTVRRLQWLSGSVTGSGTLNVGHSGAGDGQMELDDSAGSKTLSGPKLHLYGSGRIGASNTLLLQASSSIHVAPGSTLVHEALSQMLSGDDTAVSLSLDADSTFRFETGAASSGSRGQAVISVPCASRGQIVVAGSGEAVFKRDGRFRTLACEDQAGVRLQGLGNATQFSFSDAVSLPLADQYLLIQSARVEMQSNQPSTLHALALLDGALILQRAGLDLDTLSLGSAVSSSLIQGPGPVQVKSLKFQAGQIAVDRVDVSEELLISTNGAKELRVKNLTLQSGSVSHIGPSQTRVANTATWTLADNATMLVEGGATLYAERPADALQGTPVLRVEGLLRWQGRPGERAASTLQITNLRRVEVANRALLNDDGSDIELATTAAAPDSEAAPNASPPIQPFETTFSGGLDSSPDSVLSVRASSLLSSSCHPNMTSRFGCTLGEATGPGHLVLQAGLHTLFSPLNVSHLTVANGRAVAFKRLHHDSVDLLDGVVELHEYAFVQQLLVRGGRLTGFPVLNSALVVLPGGRGLLNPNATLSLDGVSLICEGACEARGADWVLSSGAQLVVAPTGSMRFSSPITIQAGVGGGGRLVNSGLLAFAAGKSAPIVLRVPMLNRGEMSVEGNSALVLLSRMDQDAPVALLRLDGGSSLSVGDDAAAFLELRAGRLQSEGTINAHVQIGGRLVRAAGSGPTVINGDVVLAPTASISSHCAGGGSGGASCAALRSNGTVWLNGLANFTFATSAGSFELVRAAQVIGTFKDSASGSSEGGSMYNLLYSPQSAGVSMDGWLQGAPTPIPSLYDLPQAQHTSAVYVADLAPSPTTPVDSAPVFRSSDLARASDPDPWAASAPATRDPSHSTEMPAETDPADPAQPAVVPTGLQRVGSWGMSTKTSEHLHVAFFIIAALLGALALALGWYAHHARGQLAALRQRMQAPGLNVNEGVAQPVAAPVMAGATGSTVASKPQDSGSALAEGLTGVHHAHAATINPGGGSERSSSLHPSQPVAHLFKHEEGVNAGEEGEEGIVVNPR